MADEEVWTVAEGLDDDAGLGLGLGGGPSSGSVDGSSVAGSSQSRPVSALTAQASAVVLAARRELVPGVVRARAEAFVAHERATNAQERFVVGIRTRVMAERVEQHQSTEHALHLLNADVRDAMGKGIRSRHALDALESRVVRMRVAMRAANDAQDAIEAAKAKAAPPVAAGADAGVAAALSALSASAGLEASSAVTGRGKSAAQQVADELQTAGVASTERCPKCARRHLPGFLRQHLLECTGGAEDRNSSDEGSSGSDGGGAPEEGDAAAAAEKRAGIRSAASRAQLRQCARCLRKFAPERIAAHRDRCDRKARLEATLNAQAEGVVLPHHLALPPQALVNVRALAPTSSTVPLVWEPPLYDGGAPIFDYQVRVVVWCCSVSLRCVAETTRSPHLPPHTHTHTLHPPSPDRDVPAHDAQDE